jgi:hypothetical protein
MIAMVRIFSSGERWSFLFTRQQPSSKKCKTVKWEFSSIPRDHNQPIDLPHFNKVLYKNYYTTTL